MKVRLGFVSNSSSSSFVLRGIKFKIKELAKILSINPNIDDLYESIEEKFSWKSGEVNCETSAYYLGGDYNTADIIVGVEFDELSDGTVIQLKEPDDNKIRKKIEDKVGKVGPLKTYIRYISNDNY